MHNIRFTRNIFAYSQGEASYVHFNTRSDLDLTTILTQFDRNLIFSTGSDVPLFSNFPAALVEKAGGEKGDLTGGKIWQRLGYDKHSILADPKFVDLENDNYALQTDSPAWELGFNPIDTSQIGLLPDHISR